TCANPPSTNSSAPAVKEIGKNASGIQGDMAKLADLDLASDDARRKLRRAPIGDKNVSALVDKLFRRSKPDTAGNQSDLSVKLAHGVALVARSARYRLR